MNKLRRSTQINRKIYSSSTEISENYQPVDEVDNDNDDDIGNDNDNDNFQRNTTQLRRLVACISYALTASQNAALLFSVSSFSFRFSCHAGEVLNLYFRAGNSKKTHNFLK